MSNTEQEMLNDEVSYLQNSVFLVPCSIFSSTFAIQKIKANIWITGSKKIQWEK